MVVTLILAAAAAPHLALAASPQAPAVRSAKRSVLLSPGQMFKLAEQAAGRGDTDTADSLLSALSKNPDSDIRAEARFRRATQLIAKGQARAAAVLLRSVLDEKPHATGVRLHLAQLLQTLGDPDAALRELRSAQVAGLPRHVAQLIDRFSESIRATRPSGYNLEVAFAPDTNINRATRSDTLGTVIGDFEIDEDSKAKSGVGLALRGHAYRRFETPFEGATLLTRLSASSDLYKCKDFRDVAVDFAAGPELRLGNNRVALEAGVTQRWFGQEPILRSARVGASWSRPLGRRTQARLSGTVALVDNRLNDLQDGKTYFGRLEVERALNATTGVSAHASMDRQSLKDPGYSTSGQRAGLLVWKDMGRMTVTLGGTLGRVKADQRLTLFRQKRSDRYSSLTMAATFRQLRLGGFAPVARVTVERNRSTLEFHNYSRTRTELGVARAF
jgi:hypothetical protein